MVITQRPDRKTEKVFSLDRGLGGPDQTNQKNKGFEVNEIEDVEVYDVNLKK